MRTLSILLSIFMLSVTGSLCAQQAKAPQSKATDKAAKARGTGDVEDPNVKKLNERNSATAAKLPIPPRKGGPAARGVCVVHFDNQTQLVIQTFVDGDYQGAVGSFGDLYADAISGATRLYGRAIFDNGTVLTFGPRIIDCHGVFTWTLTD